VIVFEKRVQKPAGPPVGGEESSWRIRGACFGPRRVTAKLSKHLQGGVSEGYTALSASPREVGKHTQGESENALNLDFFRKGIRGHGKELEKAASLGANSTANF